MQSRKSCCKIHRSFNLGISTGESLEKASSKEFLWAAERNSEQHCCHSNEELGCKLEKSQAEKVLASCSLFWNINKEDFPLFQLRMFFFQVFRNSCERIAEKWAYCKESLFKECIKMNSMVSERSWIESVNKIPIGSFDDTFSLFDSHQFFSKIPSLFNFPNDFIWIPKVPI